MVDIYGNASTVVIRDAITVIAVIKHSIAGMVGAFRAIKLQLESHYEHGRNEEGCGNRC